MKCMLCPRQCGVDRGSNGETGYCGMPSDMYIAKYMLHKWEEPVLCGTHGAGAIFFSGCGLRCVYCQNREISRRICGERVSVDRLCEIIKSLASMGAACIDLVTPTHYADKIAQALREVKPELDIPVVYNCGGYESTGTIDMMSGLVDIYMPDFKFFSPELSRKYSGASDYCKKAVETVACMYGQTGKYVIGDDGIMKSGVIVRHLVLPGCRHDSADVLRTLVDTVPPQDILLSLMSQYTPEFARDSGYPELGRRVTTFEYRYVLDIADKLGFDGFMQEKTSADVKYKPDF